MAFLKDAFSLVDTKLAEVFNRPAHDPEKARKPLKAGLERTLKQFEDGKTKVPHRWWSVNAGVVQFAPKLAGEALTINGQHELHIPQERFPDFIQLCIKAVDAGEFDGELENHGKGDATVAAPKAPRAARKPRDPNAAPKAGWSDERRAKFAQTVAARKAAANG